MIKTLIFDLSEVLIAGLLGIEKLLTAHLHVDQRTILPAFSGQLLHDLCCGDLSEDEYLGQILQRQSWSIAPHQIKRIIRDNFHHRVPGMESLLTRLAPQYELILLSDHAAEWIAYIQDIHPHLELFKARFFSFQLQQTKRAPSTFQKVLSAIERQPEQCLVVDDSAQNVDSAAAVGIAGIRFATAQALMPESLQRAASWPWKTGHSPLPCRFSSNNQYNTPVSAYDFQSGPRHSQTPVDFATL